MLLMESLEGEEKRKELFEWWLKNENSTRRLTREKKTKHQAKTQN